jgi:hypothetical protein
MSNMYCILCTVCTVCTADYVLYVKYVLQIMYCRLCQICTADYVLYVLQIVTFFVSPEVTLVFSKNELLLSISTMPSLINSWTDGLKQSLI